jgi:hypothetical protein
MTKKPKAGQKDGKQTQSAYSADLSICVVQTQTIHASPN